MKQPQDNRTADFEDIMVWPNGTWCYRYELSDMNHMSDDYRTIYFETEEYGEFQENLLGE